MVKAISKVTEPRYLSHMYSRAQTCHLTSIYTIKKKKEIELLN